MNEPTIDVEKARSFVDALVLQHGSHASPEAGLCVLEAVAYIAGEPHSDHPKCASRVLTNLCIRLNDRWDADRRQKLKPYIIRLVGTRSDDETEHRRAFMASDWAVREAAPMAMDFAGLTEWAEKLRALPKIVDATTAKTGRELARQARDAARQKRASAFAADAFAADAFAAAAAAADDAAADDAADADAADADADAFDADAAARANLKPLRENLDASVLGLVDRLIAVKPGPFDGVGR